MDIDELLEKGFNYQVEYVRTKYIFLVRINKKTIYSAIITSEKYKLEDITNYFISICKEYMRDQKINSILDE